MTTETIAPTRERLAKGYVQGPENTQKTKRPYSLSIDLWRRMLNDTRLSQHQHAAAQKFERHLLGSLGVDVRQGEVSGPVDLDGIPPITYHSNQVAQIAGIMPPRQFAALSMVVTSTDNLVVIGRALGKYKSPGMASASATTLIQEGLTLLVAVWGMMPGQKKTGALF